MYDEKYYSDLYLRPLFSRLRLSRLYYLWIAHFCLRRPFRLPRGAKALDVGCGIGNLVWALRTLGLDAQGIDPSEGGRRLSRVPRFCRYGAFDKLPFPDSSFDLVYTTEVLEHLKPALLSPLIEEMGRVSRGRMIHLVCVKDRGGIVSQEPTHFIVETESWWKAFFEKTGFRTRTGNPFYFYPFIPYIFSGKVDFSKIQTGFFLLELEKKSSVPRP